MRGTRRPRRREEGAAQRPAALPLAAGPAWLAPGAAARARLPGLGPAGSAGRKACGASGLRRWALAWSNDGAAAGGLRRTRLPLFDLNDSLTVGRLACVARPHAAAQAGTGAFRLAPPLRCARVRAGAATRPFPAGPLRRKARWLHPVASNSVVGCSAASVVGAGAASVPGGAGGRGKAACAARARGWAAAGRVHGFACAGRAPCLAVVWLHRRHGWLLQSETRSASR